MRCCLRKFFELKWIEHFNQALWKCKTQGDSWEFEFRVIEKDPSSVWVAHRTRAEPKLSYWCVLPATTFRCPMKGFTWNMVIFIMITTWTLFPQNFLVCFYCTKFISRIVWQNISLWIFVIRVLYMLNLHVCYNIKFTLRSASYLHKVTALNYFLLIKWPA